MLPQRWLRMSNDDWSRVQRAALLSRLCASARGDASPLTGVVLGEACARLVVDLEADARALGVDLSVLDESRDVSDVSESSDGA